MRVESLSENPIGDFSEARRISEQILALSNARLVEAYKEFADWVRDNVRCMGTFYYGSSPYKLYQDNQHNPSLGDYAIFPSNPSVAYEFFRANHHIGGPCVLRGFPIETAEIIGLKGRMEGLLSGLSPTARAIVLQGSVLDGTYTSSKGSFVRYGYNGKIYIIYEGRAYDVMDTNKWNNPL